MEDDAASRFDSATASPCSARLRRPTSFSAHTTPFFTKLRSSVAHRSMIGRHLRNGASGDFLSWSARLASSANAARFSNSFDRRLHGPIFFHAIGVLSKRQKQEVSTIAQLSKSRHQASICADVTRAGSPTNPARNRAS